MTEVASQTQPRPIPGATSTRAAPPSTVAIPKSIHSLRNGPLTIDTFSPVTQNGSFEFDRIVKSGEVLKRTRKTKVQSRKKSWKPIFIVLRPNLLSIYRDKDETKLRHQINLSELTAVARQKDPKRKDKHVFGLFSPSRNYHLEARSDQDAHDWVELIRREARIDHEEEEMCLASPGGAKSTYRGFERSIAANVHAGAEDHGGGYSSSDAEAFNVGSHNTLPKTRERTATNQSSMRRPSQVDYSGAEGHGSYSDFSDTAGPAARLSTLSLAYTDPRPSTSSAQQQPGPPNSVYGPVPTRPSIGNRNASQLSNIGIHAESSISRQGQTQQPEDPERVIFHGWTMLLKSRSGVRQWKKVWMVLRPRALALYKTEEEYRPLLILPFASIIEAVEIDPISKSKEHCMQVISEERNYRFCAYDEESVARWLGAFKSLLAKRKAARMEGGGAAAVL